METESNNPPKPKAPPPLPPRTGAAAQPSPPHAAPLQLQPPGSMHEADDIGVYQHDGKLVVQLGATIPPICTRCGNPADTRVLKRYAMSFSGSAKIDMPLCSTHRSHRRALYAGAWSTFLISILLFYYAIAKESGNLGWAGGALFVTSLILAAFASNYLGLPSRIDPEYVWIKGLSRRFVAKFPPFV